MQTRGVIDKTVRWNPGTTLRIKFLNGSAFLQNKVKEIAPEWWKYGNIKFQFVASNESADIKIGFKWNGDGSSWSKLGERAGDVPQNQPSMNFGWLDEHTEPFEFRRVILHEFGHALGLKHEHQHPYNGIQWRSDVVYKYYRDQGWSDKSIDYNILQKCNTSETNYSMYDKSSIMHYSIPQGHTYDGYTVQLNTFLSEMDKEFIAKEYPFLPREIDVLYRGQNLPINGSLNSRNGRYRLVMQDDGNLVIYNRKGKGVWSSGTARNYDVSHLVLQSDGNLVIYTRRRAIWSSGTARNYDVSHLVLQSDGNLVIYTRRRAIWSSGTARNYDVSHLIMQDDGNLVLYNKYGRAIWSSGTSGK